MECGCYILVRHLFWSFCPWPLDYCRCFFPFLFLRFVSLFLPPPSLSLSLSPLSERTFGTNRGTLITSFLLLVSFSVRVPLEYRVREPARSPIIRFPFTRYYHVFPIPRIDLSHAFRALSFLSLGSNSTSGRKLFNALARLFIDLVRATVNYLGRRERDILLSTGERERERERGPG